MAIEPVNQSPLHRAARIEDALHAVVSPRLARRGWAATIIPYVGYGASGWARVLARVVLARPDPHRRPRKIRGWRSFIALPVKHTEVSIEIGDRRHTARTDRSGHVDCVVEGDLPPGWASARVHCADAAPVDLPIRVVGPDVTIGLVSDIDDTVMVTALPRPLLAAWNTFVLDEHARMAVPGMAVLYERFTSAHPGAPVFYLSTGAWNVAPTLSRFLSRHLYPAGPLLLTDWGPTRDRWFRSGRLHKRATLRRLAAEYPQVRWVLVGDDGQHDEELYREFVDEHPDRIAAVAIRRLSPTQSVLAGAVPHLLDPADEPDPERWFSASDGAGLWRQLHDADVL